MNKKAKKDGGLTINRAADLTGIDRMTLRRRLADVEPVQNRGRAKAYAVEDILRAVKATQDRKSPNSALEATKLQKQIDRLEIENRKTAGDLVAVVDVRQDLVRYLTNLKRQAFAMPRRVSQLLVGEKDATTIEQKLASELRDIFSAIAHKKWDAMNCPHCQKEIRP